MMSRVDDNKGMPGAKAGRRILAATALGALALLTGCADPAGFRPGCPNVAIVRDAGTLRVTDAGGAVAATALLANLPAACQYNNTGVSIGADLTISAQRAAGSNLQSVTVEYFVAVTDPQRNVLTKQVYQTTIALGPDGTGAVRETLAQFIPAPVTVDARWYEVLVGFQLPTEQVEMNRRLNEKRS